MGSGVGSKPTGGIHQHLLYSLTKPTNNYVYKGFTFEVTRPKDQFYVRTAETAVRIFHCVFREKRKYYVFDIGSKFTPWVSGKAELSISGLNISGQST